MYVPKDGFMRTVNEGRKYGYSECCIEVFDILMKHHVSPQITLELIYGEDSCETHVRCPKCRDKRTPGAKFKVWKYIQPGSKKMFDFLMQTLKNDIRIIREYGLLPMNANRDVLMCKW